MRFDGFKPVPFELNKLYTESLIKVFEQIDRIRAERHPNEATQRDAADRPPDQSNPSDQSDR